MGVSKMKEDQEKGAVGFVIDGDAERRAFDRRRVRHGLDRWLGTAIGQAEGKTAERWIGIERRADLLQEIIERRIANCGIAVLDIDLNFDDMLVIDTAEAAERLLRLAGITVTKDDEPAVRNLFRQHTVSFDDGIRDCLEPRLERLQHLLGLACGHDQSRRSR
jgi:hypothetical protein